MKTKKYYTIGEVTEKLNIPASQLRYLENTLSTLKVLQIKGRRYYTQKNIEIIQNKLSQSDRLPVKTDIFIVEQIDNLIKNFNRISDSLKNLV
jgi:uncharacterized protein (UPF0333 family)